MRNFAGDNYTIIGKPVWLLSDIPIINMSIMFILSKNVSYRLKITCDSNVTIVALWRYCSHCEWLVLHYRSLCPFFHLPLTHQYAFTNGSFAWHWLHELLNYNISLFSRNKNNYTKENYRKSAWSEKPPAILFDYGNARYGS